MISGGARTEALEVRTHTWHPDHKQLPTTLALKRQLRNKPVLSALGLALSIADLNPAFVTEKQQSTRATR